MRVYKMGASSMSGTYTAGTFVAESEDEAQEKAREAYRNSPLGRGLKNAGAFRFYVISSERVNG